MTTTHTAHPPASSPGHHQGRGSHPPCSNADRERAIRKVTHIGSVLDLFLAVLKISVGWFAQSQALIADGVHSLSDLATNFIVLFASREAHREADEEHPYGHGRIEAVATVGLSLVLILVAVGIGYDAIHRLFEPNLLMQPGALALVAAFISVLAKEWIYRYTLRVARRFRSSLLQANAWHSRSDAISSIVVIIGVAGAMAGLPYVDAIAAVVVAGMITRIGIELGLQGVRELIDTGVEAEELGRIHQSILSVGGVSALHMLRTRRMGGNVLVDVHITLSDPRLSVSEGHQISEVVMETLQEEMAEVTDVTVHIDPEDDEVSKPNRALPLREAFNEKLLASLSGLETAAHIQRINLHYLDGKIHMEILLPGEIIQAEKTQKALLDALGSMMRDQSDIIASVRLLGIYDGLGKEPVSL